MLFAAIVNILGIGVRFQTKLSKKKTHRGLPTKNILIVFIHQLHGKTVCAALVYSYQQQLIQNCKDYSDLH